MTEEGDKAPLERVFEWYEANVPMRLGVAALAVPTMGKAALFDIAITSALAYLRRKRIECFRNQLVVLNFKPTEDEIKSEEFMDAFLATASRIQQTRRDEKIKLLTRLFAGFWATGDYTVDAFEAYEHDLSVLDETDLREISLLSLLASFEEQVPLQKSENLVQRSGRFWDKFLQAASTQLGIDSVEVENYLQRISRTALYQPLNGAYWDYYGGRGYLTPRFYRLRERIGTAPGAFPGNAN